MVVLQRIVMTLICQLARWRELFLKIKMEMEQVKDPNESGFEGVDVIITDSLGTSQTVATDDEEHTKLWCLLDLL
jgi:hypothetical protein